MTIDEALDRLKHPKQVDRKNRKLVTFSQLDTFRNCRQKADWRYIQNLVPVQVATALFIGHVNHQGLQAWYNSQGQDLEIRRDIVLDLIDCSYPERTSYNIGRKRDWHLSRAMLDAYMTKYTPEEFTMLATEVYVEGEVRNPVTSAQSRSFVFTGMVDGIAAVTDPGKPGAPQYYIVEHKNVTGLDSAFIDKLWQDFQTTLYAYYVQECFGIPISGVIYNALVKAKIQQHRGETEEEFEARRQEAIAASKTGKTSIKRKMPETDEEFQARLAQKYQEPGMFHRERLYIDSDQYSQVRYQVWLLTQQWLYAARNDGFYQNTSHCFHWGRACAYYPLCKHPGDQFMIENYYERREPHEELIQSGIDDETHDPEIPF